MKIQTNALWGTLEKVVPWLVLAILLTYTYAKFFRQSYGFRPESSTGRVIFVFDKQPEPTLREEDRILQVGSVPWEDFRRDLDKSFFHEYEPGAIIPMTVERDGQTLEIEWTYPSSLIRAEVMEQVVSEWFMAYFFWLSGVLTLLLVRPKDDSWLLMSLFNFLTAIWLIAGSGLAAYHIWYSAIVLRVVIWLCLPIYLHLHWVFPRPLGKLPPWLVVLGYGAGAFLAVAQAFQLLPSEWYLLGFLIAVGGSLILLVIHIWRQPAIRRDFWLPLIVLIMAVAPAAIWVVLDNIIKIPALYGGVGILSLPFLPLAYLYTAFRRRLGTLELRVNRFFTIYIFVISLGIIGLLLIAYLDQALDFLGKAVTFGAVSALITIAAFIWGYPPFERFIDNRIFGVSATPKRLLEDYSTHITTSVSLPALIRVLQEEVFPSLLIRQFSFLHFEQGSLTLLSTMGLDGEQLPSEKDVPNLIARSGFYRAPDLIAADQPYSWIRLVLSLKLGDQLIGFWLLGRRDPDDFYSQQEVLTLSSLANLTAIALSNILQTERITSMYQANINRYEQEHVSWARDLHDGILNELAALPIRSDAPVFSPEFQEAYDGISDHLREIIHNLRPSMLSFGLKLALDAYADNLRQRGLDSVEVRTDIQADGDCRYPLLIEGNVYRIVQEACENSLRYAHAKSISIGGVLTEQKIEIRVEDDGVGLDVDVSLKLDDLLVHKHFGLAGMHERASVIGAELYIHSKANEGTQIHMVWKVKETI